MSKKLVAYFSASGITAKLAERLAKLVGADLYEIQAEQPYSVADLDYKDKNSRSSIEMVVDKSIRPAVVGKVKNIEQYDVVYLGFPIWWYVAPTIINTFLEGYDWTGKTIVPFATSGRTLMGETNAELAPSCPGANLVEGLRFDTAVSDEELKAWAETVLNSSCM